MTGSLPRERRGRRSGSWGGALGGAIARLSRTAKRSAAWQVEGRLVRMVGLTLEAVGCRAAVGSRCLVESSDGKQIEAEVVGFSNERLFLMPTGEIQGLEPDCRVIPSGRTCSVGVGVQLLGRVIDGAGYPWTARGV